jgi:hypothetical protein
VLADTLNNAPVVADQGQYHFCFVCNNAGMHCTNVLVAAGTPAGNYSLVCKSVKY